MTDILGMQISLFILLTLVVGIIIGCVVTVRHYQHRDALREAEELGRKKELTRKAPPTEYDRLLSHLNALCDNDRVEGYEVRAYGETFTFQAAKDETD